LERPINNICREKERDKEMPKQSEKILEKMSSEIMEKLQKRVKAARTRPVFFYDYTNVSLMTDFAPRTPGLGGGSAAAYFGIKIC
jgi:hypothetical protein